MSMNVNKIDEYIYEIPPKRLMARVSGTIESFKMKVPVHIYANEEILSKIQEDRTLEQISNVACLDGVEKHVVALSDAHQGYGFCIGAVCGTNSEDGMISPGGVGYDINCGVRLLRTDMCYADIQTKLPTLLTYIFNRIPSGLGSRGRLKIDYNQLNSVLDMGVEWARDHEFATDEDIEFCEENGRLEDADHNLISKRAKQRGIRQLGSLGSGNHFLEVQKVDKIYNKKIAKELGISQKDQITVMIHTGSRALGHQVCTESVREFEKAMKRYNIKIPDRELSCVPANTEEAQKYFKEMACAANFGFCNRQLITFWIRESFKEVFGNESQEYELRLIYDLCHNILKKETHLVDGKNMELNIHRKGATRAFPPNHPVLPKNYKSIGQPVLIPGTMGSASYLCVGKNNSMNLTFGSTAHGSGRIMSRSRAKNAYWGEDVEKGLEKKGILVKAKSQKVIAEEAPGAYKDINQVIKIQSHLNLIEKVARMHPIGVVKG
ncbi:MAG: RNA-splicing ligase RtcB [Candidatus Lokiarchaeota archaeon]|nr:RNA-splicing ligase RtcB [Candidatus Lokiarchaeota archaeon]